MMGYVRIQCAAITRGCQTALVYEDDVAPATASPGDCISARGERLLQANGWWLDHGRWVCGNHERRLAGPTP